jgi:hypothetical protein
MISKYMFKGVPKCYNCIYYRANRQFNKDELGKCIKFLGSHDKPIQAEIARYNDLMCGYNGLHHKSGELMIVDNFIMQPHI